MSDTPRTDASEDRVQAFMGGTMVVASWIARDLERDLSATRAKLERAMRVVEAVQKYAVIEYPEGLATAMREKAGGTLGELWQCVDDPRRELSDEASLEFAEWLAREMPPGTVINDPRWWAPRIVRAVLRELSDEDAKRELLFAHCRKVQEDTRHACSIAVWMTLQEALEPGADDKGLDGWMREAERRVRLGPPTTQDEAK